MRILLFVVPMLFAGAAYAGPDCSNYGGTSLAGCSAPDFTVVRTQDADVDQMHSVQEKISLGRTQAGN